MIAHHNVSLRSGKDLSLETNIAPNVTLFCQKVDGDANVIHKICCPSCLFHPNYLLLSNLHYKFWKKSDIIKGDRDNNKGVLH